MQKTKFRILIYIPILSLIYWVISFLCFILVIMSSNEQYYLLIITISFIMLIVVPTILIVSSFRQMWPCVEFTEKGIEKTLFGKALRFIRWDDIYEIKSINTGLAEWIFFSKTSLNGKSIDKCRRRKDNIYIVKNKEIEEVIKYFAPSRLL